MTDKPTAVVFGATGAQGGAVARSLRRGGRWNVRAVTRKPAGASAARLRRTGVQIVRGDLDDPALGAAVLPGADALFVVTNYWEPQRDSEYVQGQRIIDAAVAAGIDNIVYSSLPGIRDITDGALSVPHCDGKYELEKWLRGQGATVAFVQPGWYFQNWHAFPQFRLHRAADGVLTLANAVGDGCLPAVDINDLGPIVAAIIDDPARFRGVTVPVIAELRTSTEYAAIFAAKLGETVRYQPVPRETLLADGELAKYFANLFEFWRRYARDLWADALAMPGLPPMTTLGAWIDANADSFHSLLMSDGRAAR